MFSKEQIFMAVQTGDTVKVNYTGRLLDGTVFDSSEGRGPLQFTVGEGNLIKDFETAVLGMSPGDTKTVQIEAGNAYGPRQDGLVFVIPRAQIPEGLDPQLNQPYQLQGSDGQTLAVLVTDAGEESVTFDGNHPLAGKDLEFDIELVEVA
jgi:peptidylprolyl isomerase